MIREHRIAVVGGGIAGLACAHFLLNHGYTPLVLEGSSQLGGIGTHFEHEGLILDRFYHVVLDSDDDMRRLVAELQLEDYLVWRDTGMGFYLGGRLYGFNSALDLLRFRALSLPDRLRTAFGALYITRLKRRGLDLDNVHAGEWLRQIFGRRVFDRIWAPLLRAKFGDRLNTVPAYWVWNTLNREKNGKQEVKGYPRRGYQGLAEALHASIVSRGGEVRLRTAVTAIEADGAGAMLEVNGIRQHFPAVVATLPLPVLGNLARGPLASRVPLPDLSYQGVVNALVISREPLDRFYWTIVVDSRFPFQGVVETTHVIPSELVGGRHLIYLMNYCDAASEIYARPDDLVRRQAVEGLRALYPRFNPAAVEAVYVFRAPHVEPVWSVGYLAKRPAPRIPETRLYLSTTAQAYPRVTAWNTSIALARETVAALVSDLQELPEAARAA